MAKKAGVLAVLALWAGLTVFAWFRPGDAISQAERRSLKQMPKISGETLLSGDFTREFEAYSLDQFPMRDSFRTLKSLFSYNVLGQKDNNGIYIEDGIAAKLDYPLNSVSVSNALKKFDYIYEQYLKDSNSQIYVTVIPDKGCYLAEQNGYPAMDYPALFARIKTGMPWAEYVDITGNLHISDYYRTDTHWRQECILPVAETLCRALNVTAPKGEDFTKVLATQEFYGVYYGQAALPMPAEELYILQSDVLADCRVYNQETGEYGSVYPLEKLSGNDPYDVYLSGAQALLTIENPNAATDRELIVFRDSFGSALAPLLVQDYKTVTLVDIRYVSASLLDRFLSFTGQDVLFAYSTMLLNNSASLK